MLLAPSADSHIIPFGFWTNRCASCANGYTAGLRLTFNVRPGSNLTDFPNLVVTTQAVLADQAHSGKVANTATLNGQTVPTDLIFTSDAAGTTLLSWEIESWNNVTGALKAWVKFDRSSTTDNVIYLWVGKSPVTTYQGNSTSTWSSNYAAVWHFPDGSTLSTLDSTSYANNGTSSTGFAAATGKVGGGTSNGLSTGGIFVTNGASLNPSTGPLTFSAWVNINSFGGGSKGTIISQNTSSAPVYAFQTANSGVTNGLQFYINPTGVFSSNNVLTTGAWHFVAVTYAGTSVSFYVDGAAAGTATLTTSLISGATGVEIGNVPSLPRNFDGSLDELRVATLARSSDWIAHEYLQQSQGSSWFAVVSLP